MKKTVCSTLIVSAISLGAGVGCMGMSEQESVDNAPPSVQSAAAKAASGHKINKIEKENEDGKTVYEASFEVNDVEHTISFDEAGTVLEEESEVKVADLPPAVSAAVLKAQPLARVKEAAMVKKGDQSYYEVDAKVGEDKHELAIAADGKLISDKVEADEDKGEGREKKGHDHEEEREDKD